MYLGTYAYWLHKLAAAGISCSILSVDYPLAPGEGQLLLCLQPAVVQTLMMNSTRKAVFPASCTWLLLTESVLLILDVQL
jgi:hypothetical protein